VAVLWAACVRQGYAPGDAPVPGRDLGADTGAAIEARVLDGRELDRRTTMDARRPDAAGQVPDAWPAGKNLLVNGDCELGSQTSGNVVGWTASSCAASWSCGNRPNYINPPQSGKLLFFAGPCTPAELDQIVDVSSFAALIDQGKQKFSFSGWVSTWQQQKDSSRFIVEYHAASVTTPLSVYDSGPLAVPLPWKQVTDVRAAPPGTRAIRVRLIAVRNEGTENDGYFDSLLLTPSP
jgi:hypothetical protein